MKSLKSMPLVIGLLLALVGCGTTVQADETTTLRLAESFPETHIISKNMPQVFMERVEKASDGRIKFDYYPGEQLGKAADMLNLLKGGVTDIAFVGPTYLSESLPMSTVATLPGVYERSADGTNAFLDLTDDLLNEEELSTHRSVALMSFVLDQYQFMTVNSKIESIDDVRGLRTRTSGAYQEITTELVGAIPVSMSGPDMYSAFQRGTVNSSLLTTDSMAPYKMEEIIDFATTNLALGGFPGHYAISEDTLEKLDPELRQILIDEGRKVSHEFAGRLIDYQKQTIPEFEDQGVEFYQVDDQTKKAFDDVNDEVQKRWAKTMDERGQNGTKILAKFRSYEAKEAGKS